MALRLARLMFVCGAAVVLFLAYEQYEERSRVLVKQRNEEQTRREAQAEVAALSEAPVKPLKQRDEALEELLTRLLHDTELLGSSVRLDVGGQGLTWTPVRFGVEKAALALGSASEASAAMGYFTLLWELLEARSVRITEASIALQDDVASFNVNVDLYGLSGDTP